MKCLRILAGVLAAIAAFAASRDVPRERIVLYLDRDSPRTQAFARDIEASLRSRTSQAVRVEVAGVDLDDDNAADPALRRVLARNPDVLIAGNSNVAMSAKLLTSDVPIVFASHQDPIAIGLAESLARPGGNATGYTYFVPIDQKRLELLRQIVPGARRLGIVVDRWWLDESGGRDVLVAAREKLGLDVSLFHAESQAELDRALASPQARRMDAWYVPYTALAYERPEAVAARVGALRKPAVYATTRFVQQGGLVSYQQLLPREDVVRVLARASALILAGMPTGEIPVERPKSFELAINVAAARDLGIAVPEALLKRADRVIDGQPTERPQ